MGRRFALLVAAPTPTPSSHFQALIGLGEVMQRHGAYDQAAAHYTQGLALMRELEQGGHIAQALIRAGLVDTTNEAVASRWLGARYFVPKADREVFAAVQSIRAAGGAD